MEALPQGWTGNLMGQMRDLDSTVDRLGYLRLTTRQPVTRLIGNVVSPEMAAEAAQYGISATGKDDQEHSASAGKAFPQSGCSTNCKKHLQSGL